MGLGVVPAAVVADTGEQAGGSEALRHGIRKNARNKIARFLDTDELERLGHALDACANHWPEAVAAIRLLVLTGCRRGEALNLRWRNVGADTLKLEDSKTVPRTLPLGTAAFPPDLDKATAFCLLFQSPGAAKNGKTERSGKS